MNGFTTFAIGLTLFTGVSSSCFAESLRCGGSLAQIGDTKADILDKCGAPLVTDTYCEPIALNTQPQGVQNGDNNVQYNTAIATCVNVDIWTYNPGKGKFMAHLYFSQGELQKIRYGDRAK